MDLKTIRLIFSSVCIVTLSMPTVLASQSLSANSLSSKKSASTKKAATSDKAATEKAEETASEAAVQSDRAAAYDTEARRSGGSNLTVYNQNFGLVREVRQTKLESGVNFVKVEDVAAAIDPTTVSLVSVSAPNAVTVLEQNYKFDLMDPQTVLSRSVGKNVKFRQTLPSGAVQEISGTLLNPPLVTISDSNGNTSQRSQGLVVKTDNGIVLNPQGQVQLSELPAGLIAKPLLLWKVECTKAGEHDTEISYQTKGLSWKCDYVTVCDADDAHLDITSWVTLDNKSGASYNGAALKLLAGDVHKVQQEEPVFYGDEGVTYDAAAAPQQQFKEESFAEYHLYSLQNRTDVNDNETKQLSLFTANEVPCKKRFIFEPNGNESAKVQVKLEVDNTEKNQLGIPMPKGKLRVYKRDEDGALQFIGEDLIDHTPRDEKVRVYIGDAFDVVGERKQMNYVRVSNRVTRATIEISLRNHKEKPVAVTAVEKAYGHWKILSSSHKYEKKDSSTFEFTENVPGRGEVKITYEIELGH